MELCTTHGGLDLPTSTNLRQSPTGVPTPAPCRLSLTGTLFSSDPGLYEVDGLNCRSAQGSAQGSAQVGRRWLLHKPLSMLRSYEKHGWLRLMSLSGHFVTIVKTIGVGCKIIR